MLGTIESIAKGDNSAYKYFLGFQMAQVARRHLAVDPTITSLDSNSPERKSYDAILRDALRHGDPLEIYDRFISLRGATNVAGQLNPAAAARDAKLSAPRARTKSHYANGAHCNMNHIEVTTLLIHADDDPIVDVDVTEWETYTQNKHLIVLHTKRGGHVGFFDGWLPFGSTWCDTVSSNFIGAVLESHASTSFLVDVLTRAIQQNGGSLATAGSSGFRSDGLARICSASDLRQHVWSK
jgi:hypothetical protein